jgi:hypothetical protein
MGVRHDALALDDEAATKAAGDSREAPWLNPIRALRVVYNLYDGLFRIGRHYLAYATA